MRTHTICRYEGAYFQGMRQGTGVYHYAGANGGVYIGEWLKGRMNGLGLILYPDGEYYIGSWRHDKKDGVGVFLRIPIACFTFCFDSVPCLILLFPSLSFFLFSHSLCLLCVGSFICISDSFFFCFLPSCKQNPADLCLGSKVR
jgi:hypothetical protein